MDNSVSEKDHSPSADSANKQASIESDSLDVKTLELFAQFSASLFSNDLSESQLSPLLAELAAALDADVFTHFIRVPPWLETCSVWGATTGTSRPTAGDRNWPGSLWTFRRQCQVDQFGRRGTASRPGRRGSVLVWRSVLPRHTTDHQR